MGHIQDAKLKTLILSCFHKVLHPFSQGCGKKLFTYSKVHTCAFDAEKDLTPGDGFHVAVLDTACGPVKTGAMICFDREFPESARILMLKGANSSLYPTPVRWR